MKIYLFLRITQNVSQIALHRQAVENLMTHLVKIILFQIKIQTLRISHNQNKILNDNILEEEEKKENDIQKENQQKDDEGKDPLFTEINTDSINQSGSEYLTEGIELIIPTYLFESEAPLFFTDSEIKEDDLYPSSSDS
jgi:hypothetical protein